MCLLMHDTEPLKPTNTGWLIADLIEDTSAFGWLRTRSTRFAGAAGTSAVAALYRLPRRVRRPERVSARSCAPGKRPLFILLDATWTEARKMFRKAYLDKFPVLSLQAEQMSRYRLRRSKRDDHFCTAEVAAMCLDLAGDSRASQALDAYLDVFSLHYLSGKRRLPLDERMRYTGVCIPSYSPRGGRCVGSLTGWQPGRWVRPGNWLDHSVRARHPWRRFGHDEAAVTPDFAVPSHGALPFAPWLPAGRIPPSPGTEQDP
jgi:DTW domain-containing protein YfiP